MRGARGGRGRPRGERVGRAPARRASRPRAATRRTSRRAPTRPRIAERRAGCGSVMPLPMMNTPSSRSGASARPDREVLCGIEPALERELHRRDVGVGIGELERDERAVVEAAVGVRCASGSRAAPSSSCTRAASAGLAGRRPGDLVRRRAGSRSSRRASAGARPSSPWARLFPVRGDHEQRLAAASPASVADRAQVRRRARRARRVGSRCRRTATVRRRAAGTRPASVSPGSPSLHRLVLPVTVTCSGTVP